MSQGTYQIIFEVAIYVGVGLCIFAAGGFMWELAVMTFRREFREAIMEPAQVMVTTTVVAINEIVEDAAAKGMARSTPDCADPVMGDLSA